MGGLRKEEARQADAEEYPDIEHQNGTANTETPTTAASSEELFNCLHTLLNQVEEAEGSVDLDLRERLSALYTETRKVPVPSSSETSESAIQSQLDELTEKMSLVETKISELAEDPEVRSLLGATADLWMPVITATADERRRNVPST